MEETLLNNIDEIMSLNEEIDRLTQQRDALKESVLSKLDEEGVASYITPSNIKVTVGSRTTFKYTDEVALIDLCRKEYKAAIKETINTAELNNALKNSAQLSEALNPYYEVNTTKYLTLKRI